MVSMKNFLTYITELFDRPFSYNALRGGFGRSGQSIFVFEPDKNEKIRVSVELFGEKLYLSFTSNGSMELTGKGNAGRILATVMDIMKKFLEHSTPDEITFIAPTDSPARARVYERMVKRYLQGTEYELVKIHRKKIDHLNPDEIWFHISHKDNVF